MNVIIKSEPFNPWQMMEQYQSEAFDNVGHYGATAVFVGTMRDFNDGEQVDNMTLEHYPGMTEKRLQELIEDTKKRWPVEECLIIHRVGYITPGEPIVLTAVWSAHRKAAFEACRHMMEILKSNAPFWKKETLDDGDKRWVERNTPNY